MARGQTATVTTTATTAQPELAIKISIGCCFSDVIAIGSVYYFWTSRDNSNVVYATS